MKKWLFGCIGGCVFAVNSLFAHCQMPCGIYHDDMVFDQIDQYVETMVKAVTVLEDNKFSTLSERNEAIRWVMEKESESNNVAELITCFFLQQKIKPGESDTAKRVLSAHKLLFFLVKIKQTVDISVVSDFYEEWEKFKLMFHIEGYKCKVNQAKLNKWRAANNLPLLKAEEEAKEAPHTHEDGTSHTH